MVVAVEAKSEIRIGRAKLFHGDCREKLQLFSNESVDFIVTDPPYECSQTLITRLGQKDLDSHFGDWDKFFTDWLDEAYRVLKQDSGMVVFVPATRFETLYKQAEKAGFRYVQPWFWHKTNPPVAIRGTLQWAVEHMIYFRKGKHKLRIVNKGKCHNTFDVAIETKNRYHKTQKPLVLMAQIIGYVSDEEQTILDPFNGVSSTGVAAVANRRNYIGIEQNKNFFDISCNRLRQEVGFE